VYRWKFNYRRNKQIFCENIFFIPHGMKSRATCKFYKSIKEQHSRRPVCWKLGMCFQYGHHSSHLFSRMPLVSERLLPLVTPHLPQKIWISHSRRSSVIVRKRKVYGCPDVLGENIMPPDLTFRGQGHKDTTNFTINSSSTVIPP
jgi:hypothetical protein